MKNFMTNALILTALLTSSQVFAEKASSGNGGGYNGPTLSGDAVEMSLDKPVSEGNFLRVINSCMYDYDKMDGFLLKTLQPIGGWTRERLYVHVELIEGYSKLGVGNKVKEVIAIRPYVTFKSKVSRFEMMEIGAFSLALGSLTYLHSEFQLESSLRIIADSVKKVKVYDPITQDEVGTDKFYVGLKILRNADEPAYITLKNKSTNRETPLLAPMADLTNCIVDGLGKI